MTIDHEYTKKILDAFGRISQIPRQSKHEEKIAKWLVDWAKENGLEVKTDEMNNVLIEVPASTGYEDSETLVIQGHMDMVCEKAKGSPHDFDKDPIQMVFTDDGWLKANQTTLGADNGIAIAMAMVAATDREVNHPKLELLFTVDEETGLTGASSLQPGFVRGKLLLNIDSEDEGIFTVGCAGGENAEITLPFVADQTLPSHSAFRLVAGGMFGGHSGCDISKERANAIKVLFQALHLLRQAMDVRIVMLEGGTARNAIPRDAEAIVLVPTEAVDEAQAIVNELQEKLRTGIRTYRTTDQCGPEPEEGEHCSLSNTETDRVIDTILVFPHGVAEMSKEIKGLVETSNNLAKVQVKDSQLLILSNQRSSNMDRLSMIRDRILAVGRLAGADGSINGRYPSWQPNMDSALLARCVDVYEKRFGKKPHVEAIHAGLECGIIGSKYDQMDMISFGPTIKNPHSPDEMIEIQSIGKVWDFMVALFESYK